MPREVLQSPSLEMLKSHLDMVLGNCLWVTLLEQGGWTRWPPELPSHLDHSVEEEESFQSNTKSRQPSVNAIRGG